MTFPAKGRCIYCGTTPPEAILTQEHIIPVGLKGYLKLPNSSCASCADITKKFEQTSLRHMLGDARIHTGLGWGQKKDQPKSHKIIIRNNRGELVPHEVPTADHPFAIAMVELPPPRKLGVFRSGGRHEQIGLRIGTVQSDFKERVGRVSGSDGVMLSQTVISPEFLRLLAKIAHSYCAAIEGDIGLISPLLLPLILEGELTQAADLIGGPDQFMPKSPNTTQNLLHDVWASKAISARKDEPALALVSIQLFKPYRMPVYQVVVGECQT